METIFVAIFNTLNGSNCIEWSYSVDKPRDIWNKLQSDNNKLSKVVNCYILKLDIPYSIRFHLENDSRQKHLVTDWIEREQTNLISHLPNRLKTYENLNYMELV